MGLWQGGGGIRVGLWQGDGGIREGLGRDWGGIREGLGSGCGGWQVGHKLEDEVVRWVELGWDWCGIRIRVAWD